MALITNGEELGVDGVLDCGLYVASFKKETKNVGVDSIAQAALASYPDLIRSCFGLPANRKLVCGISFGYSDSEHPIHRYRTGRAAGAEVATWIG